MSHTGRYLAALWAAPPVSPGQVGPRQARQSVDRPAATASSTPTSKSCRVRPGRSWHKRRCDRDREITGSSRRDPLNTSSRMRHCQEFPGTQAQPQPACRDPAAALWIGPRQATDRHDQHKLTQPARSRRSPQTVLREQKPQVRGHKTGSRDRTRTYNLPVNRRSVIAGDHGCLRCCQPV